MKDFPIFSHFLYFWPNLFSHDRMPSFVYHRIIYCPMQLICQILDIYIDDLMDFYLSQAVSCWCPFTGRKEKCTIDIISLFYIFFTLSFYFFSFMIIWFHFLYLSVIYYESEKEWERKRERMLKGINSYPFQFPLWVFQQKVMKMIGR